MTDEFIEHACDRCGVVNRVPSNRLGHDPRCGQCKEQLWPRVPLTANDASFADVVGKSALPVLVDFWAPWCGPCRVIAPVLEEVARERAGRVKIVKVNVDESPSVAQRFAISSIPAMKLFHRGSVLHEWVGALPKPQLLAQLDYGLGPVWRTTA